MKVQIEMEIGELEGRFVNVIKFIRSITGWGLKESKDFTDALKQTHYYQKNMPQTGKFRFTVETNVNESVVAVRIAEDGIKATVVPTASIISKDFKGCFNMVSANRVHLYLEAGENNKLSMDVDISKVQDFIKMFIENSNVGG